MGDDSPNMASGNPPTPRLLRRAGGAGLAKINGKRSGRPDSGPEQPGPEQPGPQMLALALSASRVALGAVMLAAPLQCLRAMGLESSTAKRAAFLVRMTAARDVALGGGALAASGPARAIWLLAAAGADAVDALALGVAASRGTVGRVRGGSIAVGAAAAVGVGGWVAVALRRRGGDGG